jgi:hypothetical protein
VVILLNELGERISVKMIVQPSGRVELIFPDATVNGIYFLQLRTSSAWKQARILLQR